MIASRPTQAFIDLAALRHNFGVVREHVGPTCRIAAVVKADGYGHGAVEIARVALDAGGDMLCVAIPGEGAQLREHFPDAPILVFGPAFPADVETVVHHGLIQTVEDADILPHFEKVAALYGKAAAMHLKVDTGMGRVGLQPEDVIPFMERAARREHVRFEGVCSHFATAGADQAFARRQLEVFLDVVGRLQERGFEPGLRHIANSAAVLSLPESHLDMVRPGIMLYGLRPAPAMGEGLKPVMTVVSRITKLKVVPDGTPVSYGSTYRSRGRRSIATIPMGYADGYRRGLSNRFHVIVRGKKAPVAGMVCMDMFMADVSDIEGVAKGDEVLIFGKRGDDLLPAEEMAEALGTINYEIVTGVSARVPRIYR